MERRGKTFDDPIFFKITRASSRETAMRRRNRRHKIRNSRRADRRQIERGLILKVVGPVVERSEGIEWEKGWRTNAIRFRRKRRSCSMGILRPLREFLWVCETPLYDGASTVDGLPSAFLHSSGHFGQR